MHFQQEFSPSWFISLRFYACQRWERGTNVAYITHQGA